MFLYIFTLDCAENKAQFLRIGYVHDENKLVQLNVFSCTEERNKLNRKRIKTNWKKAIQARKIYYISSRDRYMLK